jgi:hypothetical protein
VVLGFLVGIQGEVDWLKYLARMVHSPTSWVELEEVAARWKPGRMRVPVKTQGISRDGKPFQSACEGRGDGREVVRALSRLRLRIWKGR